MVYLYQKITLETIRPQNLGPLLIELGQSNFNLQYSDSYSLSYLITTVNSSLDHIRHIG